MKRVLLTLVTLVLLSAAAAGGWTWWRLSQFDARAEIEKRVTQATGRTFKIAGPVSVSFWPAIGFRGADVALANVPGGTAEHLLEAKEMAVSVAVRPLFDNRLEITGFSLVEPTLSLEVDAAGKPNWILTPAAPTSPTPPPGASGPVRAPQTISLSSATVTKGAVSYVNARTRTAYDISEISLKTALKGLDAPLSVTGEALFRGEKVGLDVDLGKFRVLLSGGSTPLSLKMSSAPVNAGFSGTIDLNTGALAGDMSASGPSLRKFAAWAGSSLGEGAMLQTFQLTGKVSVGPKRLSFENAAFQIDEVKARGDFLLEQTRATPLLSGRLEILALDLNPYLAPRTPPAGGVEVATLQPVDVDAPAGWSEIPIDLVGLKRLNTNLDITTGPLTLNKLKIAKTRMGLVVNDGYLASTMSNLEMYGGQGTGRFEVDARAPQVTIRNELAVQKVDAKAFFADAFGFDNIEGTAKLDWGLALTGRTQKEMIGSLTGDGSVTFENGVLKGVDLGGVARTIRNAMRRELVGDRARTGFTRFSAGFRADRGVIATDSLALDAQDARLTAIGTLDAGRRTIDVRLVPRLGAMGLAVPFRVNGPWDAMSYSSDILGRARPEVETKARVIMGRGR